MDLLVEFIFEHLMWGYFALMQLIIPKERFTPVLEAVIKIIIAVISCIIFVIMILGIVSLITDNSENNIKGYLMTFIPLGISIVQIVAGLIIRKKTKKKLTR